MKLGWMYLGMDGAPLPHAQKGCQDFISENLFIIFTHANHKPRAVTATLANSWSGVCQINTIPQMTALSCYHSGTDFEASTEREPSLGETGLRVAK